MAALAWLIIPLVAAIAAAFWGRWAGKHRTTGDGASLAGYERFRAAMENAAAQNAEQTGTGQKAADAEDAPAAAGKRARKDAAKAARKARTAGPQGVRRRARRTHPAGRLRVRSRRVDPCHAVLRR